MDRYNLDLIEGDYQYTYVPITEKEIPLMMLFEQEEHAIFLKPKSADEWKECINTFDYPMYYFDKKKEVIFGYHLATRIENDIWIRQMFITPEYRVSAAAFGEENRPTPMFKKYAKKHGGRCVFTTAVSRVAEIAMIKHGFKKYGETLKGFYDDGRDCNLITYGF